MHRMDFVMSFNFINVETLENSFMIDIKWKPFIFLKRSNPNMSTFKPIQLENSQMFLSRVYIYTQTHIYTILTYINQNIYKIQQNFKLYQ